MRVLTYADAVRWQQLQGQVQQQLPVSIPVPAPVRQLLSPDAVPGPRQVPQAQVPRKYQPVRAAVKRGAESTKKSVPEDSSVEKMQEELLQFLDTQRQKDGETEVQRKERHRRRQEDWLMLCHIEPGPCMIDPVSEKEQWARQEESRKQQEFDDLLAKQAQVKKARALSAASFLPGPQETLNNPSHEAVTFDPYELAESSGDVQHDDDIDDGDLFGALQALAPGGQHEVPPQDEDSD